MVWMLAGLAAASPSLAQEAEDVASDRRTALVKLVETCSPSAVDIIGQTPIPGYPGSFMQSVGSGSVIHESGYVLTNEHVAVAQGQQVVVLSDGTQIPCVVVATSPAEDIAILLAQTDQPLTPIALGRSHDVMLGEPVLIIGNPGGLTHTISTGIVTGLDRVGGGGAVMLGGMIQTDAPINGGNSGGPMINALGQQIGIIESKNTDGEGLGFAIQVDRFREILPAMLATEIRQGFKLGLDVSPMETAVVTAVEPDSPAAAAGLQVDDVVTAVGDMAVRDGVHFHLALVGRAGGQELPITVTRAGESLTLPVTLAELLPRPAEEVDGLVQGVYLEAYQGQWRELPDFDPLQAVSAGVVPGYGLYVQGESMDFFGLKFTGYIDVAADGLYTFTTTSDDGTKLWIGEDLIVDNDGLHGAKDATGLVRLAKGKHPITVTFFEHAGGEVLTVHIEGPELPKQSVPAEMLSCRPPQPAPANATQPAD